MASGGKTKIKILYLLKILQEETDAEHGLTMAQLIERLAEYGISAERKSIYGDINALREFDVDVRTYQRNPVEYAIERRGFEIGELMLVVDAIQSCRAITDKQAQMLIANVKTLATNRDQARLDRRIHVAGRIKSVNESVLDTVDAIHEALRLRCKFEFLYSRLGADAKRHCTRNGKKHVVTPAGISYDDGFYYLTAWDDEYDEMREYRLDRMSAAAVLHDMPASRAEEVRTYKAESGKAAVFGRFAGNETTTTLRTEPGKLEIVTDRFGDAVLSIVALEGGIADVCVRVCKSEQFFGWVAGMGKAVRIAAPQALVGEYRDYLRFLLED
ncbi:MAG: WYL domain-containing protein [Slackia sp.]|nr:WYL domain-containing protein [Slackia sp.]